MHKWNFEPLEPPLRLIDDQERDVGDRYYKSGSTINLQCQISRSYLDKELENILKSLLPQDIDSLDTSVGTTNEINVNRIENKNNLASFNAINSTAFTSKTMSNSAINLNIDQNNNNFKNNQNIPKNIKSIPMQNKNSINNKNYQISEISKRAENYYSNLLQFYGNQTDQQRVLLEKQFNTLVFWAKDDKGLKNSTRNRIIL